MNAVCLEILALITNTHLAYFLGLWIEGYIQAEPENVK